MKEKELDLHKKELNVIENRIDSLDTKSSRLDTLSGVTFIIALLLFLTFSPNTTVKLPVLGLSLENYHAVYLLFAVSIWNLRSYFITRAKKNLLARRYNYVFIYVYGSLPIGVELSLKSDGEIEKIINKKRSIQFLTASIIAIPFVGLYIWLMYRLVLTSFSSKITIAFSMFIIAVFAQLITMFVYHSIDLFKPKSINDFLEID